METENRRVAAKAKKWGRLNKSLTVKGFRANPGIPKFVERLQQKRQQQIAGLHRELATRNDQIAGLHQVLAVRSFQLEQHQLQLKQLAHRLDQLRRSVSWRAMLPIRLLEALERKLFGHEEAQLLPIQELKSVGKYWEATGQDPQFLLMGRRAWQGLSGWYWMVFRLECNHPLDAQLFFDVGNGFDPKLMFNLPKLASGVHKIPLFVPRDCRMIRFDPCDAPVRFRIKGLYLKRLSHAPVLSQEFGGGALYCHFGGYEQNDCLLLPDGDLRLSPDQSYRWQAISLDPKFKLLCENKQLRKGWHLIHLRISSNNRHDCAKTYFDYGLGFEEKFSINLPFTSGMSVKRLCYMHASPQNIRFDPAESVSLFTINLLKIRRVPTLIALYYVFSRLRRHHGLYKYQSQWRVWLSVIREARESNKDIMSLANFRVNETFLSRHRVIGPSYAKWIERYETPELEAIKARSGTLAGNSKFNPLVSILMPVYNSPERFLRLAIESVFQQTYDNWELCIADDASTEIHVRRVLEEYSAQSNKVKVVYRRENGHISNASNSALSLASGEYIALLDHDDELSCVALQCMIEALNTNLKLKLVYSDEDIIDADGARLSPHFKPDLNVDLLLSHNYITHMVMIYSPLISNLGGFRVGYEGSQDYDLMLRCIASLKPDEIEHVSKVLYHWRAIENSTAHSAESKNYTVEAGKKALESYLAVKRITAKVDPLDQSNYFRIRYPVPIPAPLVSLIIPTRDGLALLKKCVLSILDKTLYDEYEIIIIDNQSINRETLDWLSEIGNNPRVRVVEYNDHFNYSAINNYGVKVARGSLVGLVNNDVEVISPGWLGEMVSHACRFDIGCVGAKLYYSDGTIQHGGVILGLGGYAAHSHRGSPNGASGYLNRLQIVQNLSAVTAACLLVRKELYDLVGGLDEKNLPVAYNDVDFCLRIRKLGFRNLWTPFAELYHHESATRGEEDTEFKRARFEKEKDYLLTTWPGLLSKDPAYSGNLTTSAEDFSIKN